MQAGSIKDLVGVDVADPGDESLVEEQALEPRRASGQGRAEAAGIVVAPAVGQVAVMLNGVPINDMENGWVYWSNWDGVSDATSSIQIQRGLSAVNLATPSIGGTMNIITDPSVQKAGITARQEYGTGNFLKSTISVASGQINDKFSVNSTVVVKQGKLCGPI